MVVDLSINCSDINNKNIVIWLFILQMFLFEILSCRQFNPHQHWECDPWPWQHYDLHIRLSKQLIYILRWNVEFVSK